jgi:hypothetical protein
VTSLVFDQTAALQAAGGERDGGAAGAEHFGQEFLGEEEGWRTDSVFNHEEPAGQALFDFMEAVAGGELAKDQTLNLSGLEHALVEYLGGAEFLLQFCKGHS